MKPVDLWPWFSEIGAAMLCEPVVRDGSACQPGRLCRVPVEHRILGDAFGSFGELMNDVGSDLSQQQLAAILEHTGGVGLFAPSRWSLTSPCGDPHRDQGAHGSVILWPASEWERLHSEFMDWQYDGVEVTFGDAPFGPDDVLIFASVNFSPDCWLLVTRGPMQGKIVFWSHEDRADFQTPWADDLRSWGERLRREIHELLACRAAFDRIAADDAEDLPESVELLPVSFKPGR
jgi:hypothetical protein